jgi:glycosyltransferase involved in cell wall biosynthesis
LKILVLSFYFQPDLCAGSFRCSALVEQLKLHKNVQVEVVTTLPNRYATFSTHAPKHEVNGNVEIHRIELPSHKSGMLDQIKAFMSFYRGAAKLVANKEYDLVFGTSSRLFTAFLAARISKKLKVPLYLDIRDIFVDTIKDVLSPKISFFAKPFFSLFEFYAFRQAKRINLVSKGFTSYFNKRYPKGDFRWFTNGIDKEFLDVAPKVKVITNDLGRKLTVLYAGNIGEGQGLNTILPKLANKLGDKVSFRIIGDGGRKAILEKDLQDCENVELFPPVNRLQLIEEYVKADVLFLHLNDYPAFRKVLPSKIFEYAALGKPILAGVAGYSAQFLRDEVTNSAVFSPGDAEDAVSAFSKLEISQNPREAFINEFSRQKIMIEMAADIINLGQKIK